MTETSNGSSAEVKAVDGLDAAKFRAFSVEQFSEYLAVKFDNDVVESFRANKISGSIFLQLSEEQIGKLVSAIGDVVEISNLQAKVLVR